MTTFTQQLWAEVQPIYQAILAHPYIKGLGDGSLPLACFKYYIIQDSLYLFEYARAMSVVAAKAPGQDNLMMFNEHALAALQGEQALHESFFPALNLTQAQVMASPLAPSNLSYINFLKSTSYESNFPEGLAAVLPCYWVYAQVGAVLIKQGSPNPMYQKWIDTYGGDAFQKTVAQVIALTDKVAEVATAQERDSMSDNFYRATSYEWQFWDMAWRQEVWPFTKQFAMQTA